MEDKYVLAAEGQAFAKEDVESIAFEAALADDRVFSTLLGPSSPTGKFVIPLGNVLSPNNPIVRPKAAAESKVLISPFRVYISPGNTGTAGQASGQKDGRSAVYAGTSATDTYAVEQTISATVSNNRIDLVYARIDVDVARAAVTRAVKAIDESVTPQSVVTQYGCSVSIGVVQGTEATIPTDPALPADGGGAYYVPLAYVRLVHSHTATTQIPTRQIRIQAPLAPLSRQLGAVTVRPADGQYSSTGAVLTSPQAGIGVSGVTRPPAFLPSSMAGMEAVWVEMSFDGTTTGRSHPLNAVSVLDSSIDWRNRVIMAFWYFSPTGASFAWDTSGAGRVPSPGSGTFSVGGLNYTTWGHSFQHEGNWTTDGLSNAGPVAKFVDTTRVVIDVTGTPTSTSLVAAGASIHMYVDLTDGKLKAKIGATDPAKYISALICASGPMQNKGF